MGRVGGFGLSTVNLGGGMDRLGGVVDGLRVRCLGEDGVEREDPGGVVAFLFSSNSFFPTPGVYGIFRARDWDT